MASNGDTAVEGPVEGGEQAAGAVEGPVEGGEQAAAAGGGRTGWQTLRSVLFQLVVFYFIMSFFRGRQQQPPPDPEGRHPAAGGNLFPKGQDMVGWHYLEFLSGHACTYRRTAPSVPCTSCCSAPYRGSLCTSQSGKISTCLETMTVWSGMRTWCTGTGRLACTEMVVSVPPWTSMSLRYTHLYSRNFTWSNQHPLQFSIHTYRQCSRMGHGIYTCCW